MTHWGANGISLGINSQYCEVEYVVMDPDLCRLNKIAVEGFKAIEKLKNFSDESLDLQNKY